MRFPRTEADARVLKRFAPRDLTSSLAYLIGFRDQAYRQMAVDALRLENGDTVVEIGCGTGRNFSKLERAVGPNGMIVGVDISERVALPYQVAASGQAPQNVSHVSMRDTRAQ